LRYDYLTGAPIFEYKNQQVTLAGIEYVIPDFRCSLAYISAIPDNTPQITVNFELKF